MMKIIGLTGGIGAGKSTASVHLKEKGCFILDADLIARQMTEKGEPALREIRAVFGSRCFKTDGSLDRKVLGDMVFGNREKLAQLQKIITKKVAEEIKLRIEKLREDMFDGIAVVDAPLLFECGMGNIGDENWLVRADLPIRLLRVAKRDGLSEEQILSRMKNQMSQEEKERYADCILDNSGTQEELFSQIDSNLERIRNEA